MIRLKRVYEPASRSDGQRLLVELLRPRRLRKADAHVDEWLEDVAPRHELRRWFGREPSRFSELRERYRRELRSESVGGLSAGRSPRWRFTVRAVR